MHGRSLDLHELTDADVEKLARVLRGVPRVPRDDTGGGPSLTPDFDAEDNGDRACDISATHVGIFATARVGSTWWTRTCMAAVSTV
jgi:hypothetical protein